MMNNNLKLLRESQGITVRDLAERALVTEGTVRQIESNGPLTHLADAYAISSVLGVSVYDVWPCEIDLEIKTVTIRQVIKE